MTSSSPENRWFVFALIGGEAGAALGLLLLGGILFAPVLCAFAGSALVPLAVYARERYLLPRRLTPG